MDLTSFKLHPKSKTNEFHEDLSILRGKNEALKAFNYLKACKTNAPKMIEKKTFTVFKHITYKG